MNQQTLEVRLPAELCDAMLQRFGSRFGNVEELIVHLFRELLRDDTVKIDQAEQSMVEERLKQLGYL